MIQTLFGSTEPKPRLLERLHKALKSTQSNLVARVDDVVREKKEIDAELLEELEQALIGSDVGVGTTQEVLDAVRSQVSRRQLSDAAEVKSAVKNHLQDIFRHTPNGVPEERTPPVVIFMVGVNGTGKTTTIGKLAFQLGNQGGKVLLCAGDTFRAAAVEQLEVWGQRSSAAVVKHRSGSDPSAVLFDALSAAKSRQADYVIVDTAGRLHTKSNLMAELDKMRRTGQRLIPGAPHEILLVLDATTGQNGLEQAKQFSRTIGVTGIVLTKLDGTAKGGVALAIARELQLPIRYVGVGEQPDDLLPFDPEQFIESLFA